MNTSATHLAHASSRRPRLLGAVFSIVVAGCVATGLAGAPTAQADGPACDQTAAVAITNTGFEDPVVESGRGVPVSELPGWTVSGDVRLWGADPTFPSGSQYVVLGEPDGAGSISQPLDGAPLRDETVTFEITSVRSGTITLGDQTATVTGTGGAVTTHTVTFTVPADAPDALPLTLTSLEWTIDVISATRTDCPVATTTDLGVTLTGPPSARKGTAVTYTLQVTNHGQLTANDVTSVIAVAGLSNVTVTPMTGTGGVTIAGHRLNGARWRTPTLAPGATAPFTLHGTITAARGRSVVAVGGAAATTPPDPTLGNNVAFTATRST